MQDGYKNLITYKLARVAFDLVGDFVPRYYWRFKDGRQRDQIKQAIHSHKQGIVEGSSSQSLSSKLNLYGVAQSSGKEIKEDGEDILRLEGLPLWQKEDPRLRKLQAAFEYGPNPPNPSTDAVLAVLGKKLEGKRRMRKEEVEIVANYLVDLLARNGYLLDKQIRVVEEKHRTEGGYREKLLKRRLSFHRLSVFLYFLLFFIFFLFLPRLAHAAELSNQFTVELWVNPSGAVASRALLVKNNELRLATDSAGKPLCQIYSGSNWQTAAVSTSVLSLNSWSHVACSYDKSTLKVFLNGVQAGSASLSVALDDSAANFRVGADEGGVYGDFNGLIDDVRIYNYARTQKQILEDMAGGAPGAVRMPQPIAYWKFDEGYGGTAYNFGNGGDSKNIFLTGVAWNNNGRIHKSISFNGTTSSYGTTSSPEILNSTGSPFTITGWFKPQNDTGNERIIVGKAGWHGGLLFDNSTIRFNFQIADAANNFFRTYAPAIYNQWQYVTATYESNGIMKIYLNGELSNTTTFTGTPKSYSDTLYIGGLPSYDWCFYGSMDEVKIYNYALTPEEIKQDYNQGRAAVMGQSAGNTGSSAPAGSAAQEYCVPGSTDYCAPPVAEWNFEENTGTIARDTSGNGKDGTLINMEESDWVPGKKGAALELDGDQERIDMGSTSDFNFGTNSFTFNIWLKFGNKRVVMPISKGTAAYNNPGFRLYVNSSDHMELAVMDGTNTCSLYLDISSYSNEWALYTGKWDSSSKTCSLFINGEFIDEGTNNNVNDISNTNKILSLGSQSGGGYNFEGLIDNVRIYNYARTPAQIAWDYNRGGPVGHWRFDECEGTVAHDVSGNNLNGAINIGATAPQTSVGTCQAPGTAWGNGASGKLNYSLSFDGADDYVVVGNTGRTDIVTLSFWVKPASTTQKIIELSASDSVEISAGTVATTGFGTEKIYIDGVEAFSFTDTNWHHITVVSSAGLTANAMNIGKVGTNYYSGLIDDVRIYNYALTPLQIKTLYNDGAVSFR